MPSFLSSLCFTDSLVSMTFTRANLPTSLRNSKKSMPSNQLCTRTPSISNLGQLQIMQCWLERVLVLRLVHSCAMIKKGTLAGNMLQTLPVRTCQGNEADLLCQPKTAHFGGLAQQHKCYTPCLQCHDQVFRMLLCKVAAGENACEDDGRHDGRSPDYFGTLEPALHFLRR